MNWPFSPTNRWASAQRPASCRTTRRDQNGRRRYDRAATPGIHRSTWKPRAPDGTFFPFEQYAIIDVRQTKTDTAKPAADLPRRCDHPRWDAIAPGQKFSKTWSMRNDGNKVWDATYTLAFDSGDNMSGGASVPLPPLRPGQSGRSLGQPDCANDARHGALNLETP